MPTDGEIFILQKLANLIEVQSVQNEALTRIMETLIRIKEALELSLARHL